MKCKLDNLWSIFLVLLPLPILLSCVDFDIYRNKQNKIVFLSDRDKSNREFDVFLYDIDADRSKNLTGQLNQVVVRSNSRPKLNIFRNSVFFISFDQRNLVELNLQSNKINRITEINYEATEYLISPDGKSVVYTEKVDSVLQLIKINLTDGRKVNLTNNTFNNFEFCFSGNGEKIVYVCDLDGTNSIAIMNKDGSGQKMLTNNFGDDRFPSFSADGGKIVFSSSRAGLNNTDYDLYTIDSTGDNINLFFDSNNYDTKPVFSPGKNYVAFISNGRGGIFRDICLKDFKTGEVQLITKELNFINQNFTISKDNQFIVFENMGPLDSEIFIYYLKTGTLKNITNNKNRDVSPSL